MQTEQDIKIFTPRRRELPDSAGMQELPEETVIWQPSCTQKPEGKPAHET